MSRGSVRFEPGFIPIFVYLVRRYPRRSLVTLVLLVVAGTLEGASVLAILPLLSVVTEGDGATLEGPARQATDLIGGLGLEPTTGVLLAVIAFGILAKAALMLLSLTQAGYLASDVGADLRYDLADALMTAQWSHFTREPLGNISNAMSSEAARASTSAVMAYRVVAAAIQVAVYLVLAVMVSWYVTLGAAAVGLLMFAILRRLVRFARVAGSEQTSALRELTARLADGLGSVKALKAMGREDAFRPLIRQEIGAVNRGQRREALAMALLPSFQEPLMVAVLAVGSYIALEELDLSFAKLAFMAVVFYRTTLRSATLQQYSQSAAALSSAFWSIRQLTERAHAAVERDQGVLEPTLRQELRFEGVSFAYEGNPVVHLLDLRLRAGTITALIGPSGCGKTTIADLAAGLYRPQAGEIWVDDVPLSQASLRAWRSRIGYVPQDPSLLHDSVRVNVTLGDPRISREDVLAALRASGAAAFVDALDGGVEASVGERGLRLSGGQRQRLAIARALVRRPDLLILDEATTALDPETERAILETLRELRGSVTILAISHQPAIVNVADEVVTLTASGARVSPTGRSS